MRKLRKFPHQYISVTNKVRKILFETLNYWIFEMLQNLPTIFGLANSTDFAWLGQPQRFETWEFEIEQII